MKKREPEKHRQQHVEPGFIRQHIFYRLPSPLNGNLAQHMIVRYPFADFGHLQRALEERGITPLSAELEYIPLNPTHLSEEQATEALELVDTLEQDDDVQKVFHNLA